jgi:hypothetical protein
MNKTSNYTCALSLTILSFLLLVLTPWLVNPNEIDGTKPLHDSSLPKEIPKKGNYIERSLGSDNGFEKDAIVPQSLRESLLRDADIPKKTTTPNKEDILTRIAYESILLPKSLGPGGSDFQIVNGEIIELDDGTILKSTLLEIEGISDIVLCIETFGKSGEKLSQMFYNGEELKVSSINGNTSTLLAVLTEQYQYRIENSEIYIRVPYSRESSIIQYAEQMNKDMGYILVSTLVQKTF